MEFLGYSLGIILSIVLLGIATIAFDNELYWIGFPLLIGDAIFVLVLWIYMK